ncbi:unnamed protein product [Rotaria magnacalcarata]|nr:unnamed protein product [Rotaria magnacalcarata]
MYQGIQTLYIQQQHQHTDATFTTYYRGQRMHVEELELIHQNKYLSINTFFSTSTDRGVAEAFLLPLDQNVVQPVLFRLRVNTVNEIQPFTDIKTCSNFPDENETLFIPGTIFLISTITESSYEVKTHTSSKYWIVDLEFCNTHPREVNTTFEYFNLPNNLLTLAKLAGFSRHIGKYDAAHRCYETLFLETGKNCIDSIFGMAQTACHMNHCETAIELSEIAYKLYSIFYKDKPWDIFYYIHQGWGLALLKKKETKSLDLALKQLEKALCCLPEPSTCVDKIRLQQCHECYALGYAIIGSIYREMQEYPRSKQQYDKALRHCSELPQGHPYVYYLYIPFGKTLRIMKEYNQAIDYHTQALNFIENEYLFGHYELARVHRALGLDYAEICQYELALKHLKEVVAMYNTVEWMNLLPARKQMMAEELERIQNMLTMPVLMETSAKEKSANSLEKKMEKRKITKKIEKEKRRKLQ